MGSPDGCSRAQEDGLCDGVHSGVRRSAAEDEESAPDSLEGGPPKKKKRRRKPIPFQSQIGGTNTDNQGPELNEERQMTVYRGPALRLTRQGHPPVPAARDSLARVTDILCALAPHDNRSKHNMDVFLMTARTSHAPGLENPESSTAADDSSPLGSFRLHHLSCYPDSRLAQHFGSSTILVDQHRFNRLEAFRIACKGTSQHPNGTLVADTLPLIQDATGLKAGLITAIATNQHASFRDILMAFNCALCFSTTDYKGQLTVRASSEKLASFQKAMVRAAPCFFTLSDVSLVGPVLSRESLRW